MLRIIYICRSTNTVYWNLERRKSHKVVIQSFFFHLLVVPISLPLCPTWLLNFFFLPSGRRLKRVTGRLVLPFPSVIPTPLLNKPGSSDHWTWNLCSFNSPCLSSSQLQRIECGEKSWFFFVPNSNPVQRKKYLLLFKLTRQKLSCFTFSS